MFTIQNKTGPNKLGGAVTEAKNATAVSVHVIVGINPKLEPGCGHERYTMLKALHLYKQRSSNT